MVLGHGLTLLFPCPHHRRAPSRPPCSCRGTPRTPCRTAGPPACLNRIVLPSRDTGTVPQDFRHLFYQKDSTVPGQISSRKRKEIHDNVTKSRDTVPLNHFCCWPAVLWIRSAYFLAGAGDRKNMPIRLRLQLSRFNNLNKNYLLNPTFWS